MRRTKGAAMAAVLGLALAAASPAGATGDAEGNSARPDMTDPLTCLAIALYWEAKGEDDVGMRAVGDVVLNRVEHSAYPDDVCGVVRDGTEAPPCQFSFWCDGRADQPIEAEAFARARKIAARLLNGRRQDTTDGALYFHNGAVAPAWAHEATPTVKIGNHVFYR